jgi:Cu2+-containing amine oxidase
MTVHPLRDLDSNEIGQAATLIKKLHAPQQLIFKAIILDEPKKELALEYLRAQDNGTPLPTVPRIVFVSYYFKGTVSLHAASIRCKLC